LYENIFLEVLIIKEISRIWIFRHLFREEKTGGYNKKEYIVVYEDRFVYFSKELSEIADLIKFHKGIIKNTIKGLIFKKPFDYLLDSSNKEKYEDLGEEEIKEIIKGLEED